MAALVDTNVLVYRFDPRFPDKQRVANDVLRRGVLEDGIRIPHQAVVEFVAAVTRPLDEGSSLLSLRRGAGGPALYTRPGHRERRKPAITPELLHLEYLEQHPGGYRYTQYCEI